MKDNLTDGTFRGTSTLMRSVFSPGMLLQHGDLDQLNNYTRDLSRLLFKSLLGCGVICGLKVNATFDKCGRIKITISEGVALSCSGDPIHVSQNEIIWLKEEFDPDIKAIWVLVRLKVKACAPRSSQCCEDDDSDTACSREREGYEFKVVSARPEWVCGSPEEDAKTPDPDPKENRYKCADPSLLGYKDHYAGNCSDCDCDCKYVLLARLDQDTVDNKVSWKAEHGVRRYVRPVLAKDPERNKPKTVVTSADTSLSSGGTNSIEKSSGAQSKGKTSIGERPSGKSDSDYTITVNTLTDDLSTEVNTSRLPRTKLTTDKSTTDKLTSDKTMTGMTMSVVTTDMGTDSETITEKTDKSVIDNSTKDKADKVAVDKLAGDKLATDKITEEQTATDKTATDDTAAEKTVETKNTGAETPPTTKE